MMNWQTPNEHSLIGIKDLRSERLFVGCVMIVFCIIALGFAVVNLAIAFGTQSFLSTNTCFGIIALAAHLLIVAHLFELKSPQQKQRRYELNFLQQTLKISSFDIAIDLQSICEMRIFRERIRRNKTTRSEYPIFFVQHNGAHLWLDTAPRMQQALATAKIPAEKLNIPIIDCTDESFNCKPTALTQKTPSPHTKEMPLPDANKIAIKNLPEGLWLSPVKAKSKIRKIKKFLFGLLLLGMLGFAFTLTSTSGMSHWLKIPFLAGFGSIIFLFLVITFIVTEKRHSVLCKPSCLEIYEWFDVWRLSLGHTKKIVIDRNDLVDVQIHYFPNDLAVTIQTKNEQKKFFSIWIDSLNYNVVKYWQPIKTIYFLWRNLETKMTYPDYQALVMRMKK